jgi:predicted HTH domain antitoxin
MLTEEQHHFLKARASHQGRTLGELVREAIDACHNEKDMLNRRRDLALDAYEQGFISLGKLSEVLGLDPVTTRSYLKQKRIRLAAQDRPELRDDIANA